MIEKADPPRITGTSVFSLILWMISRSEAKVQDSSDVKESTVSIFRIGNPDKIRTENQGGLQRRPFNGAVFDQEIKLPDLCPAEVRAEATTAIPRGNTG